MSNECIRLLIIEDDEDDYLLIKHNLKGVPESIFKTTWCRNYQDGLAELSRNQHDVATLDYRLGGKTGVDLIRAAKAEGVTIPIILLTGQGNHDVDVEGMDAGATDYISKEMINSELLGRSIRYSMERQRLMHDTERRLSHLAHYDALTNLANRAMFNDYMLRALARSQRKNKILALLFIDIDRFKIINDTVGHDAGDELLRQVAGRIQHVTREGDFAARIGGDEFTVILEDIKAISNAEQFAAKLQQVVSAPINVDEHQFNVSVSIGIATYPAAGQDLETLVKNADIAMYRAKAKGKFSYQTFDDALNTAEIERMETERDLHHALERKEFLLYYQPVIDISTNQICAVEALLRWNRPGHDRLISPLEFIPLLEEMGLIEAIGEWVLRTACTQCKAWHDAGASNLRIAVNVAPRQICEANSPDWVSRVLEDCDLDPRFLEIEITEQTLMDQFGPSKDSLESLRTMGIGVSIDDFGTGYSSLSYLMNIPLDTLKIDRSFLSAVTTHEPTSIILTAIIDMAQGLGLQVIAEGVENEAQLDYLRERNCTLFQGYLFSPPVDASELTSMLMSKPGISSEILSVARKS
jgi:diguanylate cyclase (GGDEF)-like protein